MKYNVPDDFFTRWDRSDVHRLAEFFACWLRARMLKATTIDQYFTHVVNFYKERGVIQNFDALRSPLLSLMLRGFTLADASLCPARLQEKIPLTAALMIISFALAVEMHPRIEDGMAIALSGALSVGYALSLRPDEYLYEGGKSDAHSARGSQSSFLWSNDDRYYVTTKPHEFPIERGPSVVFLTRLDSSKNDLLGHGAPRAVQAAPSGSAFCLVQRIFACLRRFPPRDDLPLLSSLPFADSDTAINTFLKAVAVRAGLDPSRLVPHSARVGSIIQLAHHSEATQRRQGNWTTTQGMLAYARGSLEHAALVSPDLHDPSLCTIAYLRLMCMTPNRGAVPP